MLDPGRPDGVRLSVADARALGEATLQRIGYPADEAAWRSPRTRRPTGHAHQCASCAKRRCPPSSMADGPVIDIGTASLMWGEVLLMARLGEALPDGIGFDADGNPTRDARAVAREGGVAPFGGHKGYGLSFAIQALGLLAGAALPRGDVQDYGFLFIAIDPAVMLPDFPAQMAELVAHIKATPRQPGVDEIRIPSERAFRERERRRVEGIVLDCKVVEALNAL
jgi:LDH2 family malate/lactate/ureidoglycolate dehydrogenase